MFHPICLSVGTRGQEEIDSGGSPRTDVNIWFKQFPEAQSYCSGIGDSETVLRCLDDDVTDAG